MTVIVTSSEYNDELRLVSLSGKLTSNNRAREAKVFLADFERAPTATPATTDHFFAAVAAGKIDFSISSERKRFKKVIKANPVLRADLLGLPQKENLEQFNDPTISELAREGRQKVVDAFLSDKNSKEIYEQFMLKDEMYKSFSAEELRELVLRDVGAAAAIFDDKAPNSNKPGSEVASKIKADDIARLLAKRPENNEHYFPIVLAFALKYCTSEFEIFWKNLDEDNNKNSDWQKQIDRINEVLFFEQIKYTDLVERIETHPKAFLILANRNPVTLARLLMHANNPVQLLKTAIANDTDKSFSEFISKNAIDFIGAFKEKLFKTTFKSRAKDLFDEVSKLKLQNGKTITGVVQQQTKEKVKDLTLDVEYKPESSNKTVTELLSVVRTPDLWKDISLSGQYGRYIEPLNKYLKSQAEINEKNSKLCAYFHETYTSQYKYDESKQSYVKNNTKVTEEPPILDRVVFRIFGYKTQRMLEIEQKNKQPAEKATPDLSYEMAFLIKNNTQQYKKFKAKPTLLDRALFGIFGYKTENMIKVEKNKQSVALIKHVLRSRELKIEIISTLKERVRNSLEQVSTIRQLQDSTVLIYQNNELTAGDPKVAQLHKEIISLKNKAELAFQKDLSLMDSSELEQQQAFYELALNKLIEFKQKIGELDLETMALKNQISRIKRLSPANEILIKLTNQINQLKQKALPLNNTATNNEILKLQQTIESFKANLDKNHLVMQYEDLCHYKFSCLNFPTVISNLQKITSRLECEVELKLQIKNLKQVDQLSEENLQFLKTRVIFKKEEANISSVSNVKFNEIASNLLKKMDSFLADFQKDPESMSLSELESYKKVCEEALKTVSEIKAEVNDLSKNIEAAEPTYFVDPSSAPPSPTAFIDSRTPQATPTASVSPSGRNYTTPTAAVSPTLDPNITPTASVSPSQAATFSPAAYLSPQQSTYLPGANVSQPGSASGTPVANLSQPVSRDGSPTAYLSPGLQSGIDASISPAGNSALPTIAISPLATVSPTASASPQLNGTNDIDVSVSPAGSQHGSPSISMSPTAALLPDASTSPQKQIESPLPTASVSQPASTNVTPAANRSPDVQSNEIGAFISPAGKDSESPIATGSSLATLLHEQSPIITASVSPVPTAGISAPVTANNTPEVTASVSPELAASIFSMPGTTNNSPEITASVSPELNIGASISAPATANNSPEMAVTANISPMPTAAVSPAPALQSTSKFEGSNLSASTTSPRRLDESDGLEAKSEKTKQYLRGKSPAFVAEFFGKNQQAYEQMLLDGKAKELIDTINKALASKKSQPEQDDNIRPLTNSKQTIGHQSTYFVNPNKRRKPFSPLDPVFENTLASTSPIPQVNAVSVTPTYSPS